jgi:hypothetical protein
MLTLPIAAVGTVAMNYHGKRQVEKEFNRRRFALPLNLAPGETVQGSLFFRITPSLRELMFHCRVGETTQEISIPLAILEPLHLRPASDARTAATDS